MLPVSRAGLWHLGVVAPNYGPGISAAGLRASARAAEVSGYDSIWVTDHVAVPTEMTEVYGSIAEALVSASFLAACTSRIKIGVSALVVPQRPPLLTLKQVMGLQLLAEGRLAIAVAAGWTEQEFRNLGYSMRDRSRSLRLWESLVETVEAAAPGRIDFRDETFEISDAVMAPGFLDGRRPEMWMAGHADAVIGRAARAGVWHPVGRPVSTIGPLAAQLRELRSDAHVVLRVGVTLAADPDLDALDIGGRCRLVGPASFLAEQLSAFREAGCDGFLVDLLSNTQPLEESFDWFRSEVVGLLSPPSASRTA